MLNIVRFEQNNTAYWGLLEAAQVRTLNIPCSTTADLLALPRERWRCRRAASTCLCKESSPGQE